jgi:CO/xanthine dehydrogenase Mo-binding subunit
MNGEQIGRDLPRRDAEDKLRGRTRYAVDRTEAGMLHGALARADVPAGRITRIDTSAAVAMPGVHAVVTEADAPGLYGVGIADHPLFVREHVRFHGEPVAAVAAETLELARAAAAAIVVETEALEAHLTATRRSSPAAGVRATSPGRRRSCAATPTRRSPATT